MQPKFIVPAGLGYRGKFTELVKALKIKTGKI